MRSPAAVKKVIVILIIIVVVFKIYNDVLQRVCQLSKNASSIDYKMQRQ